MISIFLLELKKFKLWRQVTSNDDANYGNNAEKLFTFKFCEIREIKQLRQICETSAYVYTFI